MSNRFEGKLEKLEDLITIREEDAKYLNFDFQKITKIIPILQKINKMIGLENIKETIFYQITLLLSGEKIPLHTFIHGDLGTGKTLFSNLLTKLYMILLYNKDENIEKVPIVKLIGENSGDTLRTFTQYLMTEAEQIILVDEELMPREVYNVLRNYVEKNEKIVIFVCSKKLKGKISELSPNFRGVFPFRFKFESYETAQLVSILEMTGEWKFTEKLSNQINDLLSENKEHFGFQGADIKNYISFVKMAYIKRKLLQRFLKKCSFFQKNTCNN